MCQAKLKHASHITPKNKNQREREAAYPTVPEYLAHSIMPVSRTIAMPK
jgi:hypothetical protein